MINSIGKAVNMFVIFLVFLPSILLVIALMIFSGNKIDSYDCHVPGCNYSFETIEELINHLIDVHRYKLDRYNDDE